MLNASIQQDETQMRDSEQTVSEKALVCLAEKRGGADRHLLWRPAPTRWIIRNGCVLAVLRSSHFLTASRLPTKVSIARVSEKYPLENPSFLDEYW